MSLFGDRYDGPEMTLDEFYALRRRLADWLRIKAKSDPSWGANIRLSPQQMLEQLAADIEHPSLLMRMVQQRKDPLPEPPPVNNGYPVYPD